MSGQYLKFASQKPSPEFPGVVEVDPSEVWEKKAEIAIIDVRRPDEFSGELGHIPGAKSVVLDTLPDCMDQLPADKTIVFVCLSGGRSARACEFAVEQGLNNTVNMRGGMKAWHQLGLQVEGRSGK